MEINQIIENLKMELAECHAKEEEEKQKLNYYINGCSQFIKPRLKSGSILVERWESREDVLEVLEFESSTRALNKYTIACEKKALPLVGTYTVSRKVLPDHLYKEMYYKGPEMKNEYYDWGQKLFRGLAAGEKNSLEIDIKVEANSPYSRDEAAKSEWIERLEVFADQLI